MKFGFLIDKKCFKFSSFKISVVPEFNELVRHFYETACVSNGWFYGPQETLRKTSQENIEFQASAPVIYSSFFRMNSTHEITSVKPCTDEQLRFLILGYGFLQGLYLTPEGYSYLSPTAYKPSKLNGIGLSGEDYVNGMESINRFYTNADEKQRNHMFTCIHWYLISQSYPFSWDRFDAQYKVLDGIYNLLGVKAKNHAHRPIALAEKYNLKVPVWAQLNEGGQSKLSQQRNELFHEAKYDGFPIGYSYPDENYQLEFRSFNTKLIAAALGIDTPYLQAEPNYRIPCLWNIK